MVDATRLQGKTALVTGGASGIGQAIVERLRAEGAQVVVADRVTGAGPDDAALHSVTCDVTNVADVDRAVAETVDRFGAIDILVNSAGITGAPGRVHEYDLEEWDRVMAVNARGPFLTMRAVIPHMLQRGGGSIVNLASVGAFVYAGGSTVYPPSKAAVVMLTKQAAIDYAKDGIRVNAVCPGIVETPILAGAPVSNDVLTSFVPVGRLGRPEEIASFVAYLAGDEAAFVTGSALLADGGMTAA